MRRPPSPILGITIGLTVLASCTSSPQSTTDTATSADDQVTGGEIIVGGDLNDDITSDNRATTATASTIEPPAPATSSTIAPTTVTIGTTTPAPPTTARPTTTEAELVGDGPVLTSPDNSTSETPAAGGALVPAFFALEATPTIDCTTANPGTAQLRWEVIGSEAVDIAIGSVTRIFRLAQPPAGTLDVPIDCANGSTYFVVATNAEGSSTRSVSLAADAAA